MAPVLYKMDASPPANAVRIVADLIGLALELKDVDFLSKEHKSPEYLEINPMGTVPTLVDGDFAISDSHTIIKYLLTLYGGDKSESLYPSDVRTRALVDQILYFHAGVFFIRCKVVGLSSLLGDLVGPTDQQTADMDDAFSIVEAYLQKNKYLATNHLTIADIALGATAVSMRPMHKLDTAKYPRSAAWLAELEKLPSVKKILLPGVEIFGQVLNMCWEKNKKRLNK